MTKIEPLAYGEWLEFRIHIAEHDMVNTEDLLKRALIQGKLDGLREAKKMYLEKACDNGR